MPMCKLIEYTGNYLKTSESLWLYCRDKPSLNNDSSIIDFGDNDTTVLFKSEEKQTGNDSTKSVKKMILLKCLGNFD